MAVDAIVSFQLLAKPASFARFAGAAAQIVRDETDAVPFYCPVNEISFWAWSAGDAGRP